MPELYKKTDTPFADSLPTQKPVAIVDNQNMTNDILSSSAFTPTIKPIDFTERRYNPDDPFDYIIYDRYGKRQYQN